MLDALERHMPAGVRWAPPAAGIFAWVSLPAGADATELVRESLRDERVAFCPGHLADQDDVRVLAQEGRLTPFVYIRDRLSQLLESGSLEEQDAGAVGIGRLVKEEG